MNKFLEKIAVVFAWAQQQNNTIPTLRCSLGVNGILSSKHGNGFEKQIINLHQATLQVLVYDNCPRSVHKLFLANMCQNSCPPE